MKIGIMTFWETQNNYGQILQVYALQQKLRDLKHDPFVIRYKRVKQTVYKSKRKYKIKKIIYYIFNIGDLIRKIKQDKNDVRGFENFKRKFLKFSKQEYQSLSEIQSNPPVADIYITGSDQVWNNGLKVPCEPYLLGFGDDKKKKIAYAASFGVKELDDTTTKLFQKYLHAFNAVSVREKSGIRICDKLGYSDSKHVPDPTMLINKNEWQKLQSKLYKPYKTNKERIFIYTLGNSQIIDKKAYLKFAKKKHEVVHVSANTDYSGPDVLTIPEWLTAIDKSDFVITNSFHGTVFCLIFNKNFVVLPSTGKKIEMNERIKSILSNFELEEHTMSTFDQASIEKLMGKDIDWSKINIQIDKLKKDGLTFLTTAIM